MVQPERGDGVQHQGQPGAALVMQTAQNRVMKVGLSASASSDQGECERELGRIARFVRRRGRDVLPGK